MTDTNEKKQFNDKRIGYLLIVLGILGITGRLIGSPVWKTVTIIKFVFSVIILILGLWTVFMKKK